MAPARAASSFLDNPAEYIARLRRDTLDSSNASIKASAISKAIGPTRQLLATLKYASGANMASCTARAWDIFHLLFRDKIMDIIRQFPADCKVGTQVVELMYS